MKLDKRLALTIMVILGLGMVPVLSAQEQGSAQESTSRKGAPKRSGVVIAAADRSDRVPAPASPAVPEVNLDEYMVGEADLLLVSIWKEPELSRTVVVRPDGKISLPLVSEVKVSGMTVSQIQELLTARLRAYVVDPQVNVTVGDVRSKNAFITGEVARPGAYPLLMPTTVLQLIAKAGGLSPFASRGGIFILREVNGKSVRLPFPYKEVIKGKREDLNIELRPGDTVVVP